MNALKIPSEFPKDFNSLVAIWPPSAIVDEAAYENVQELIDGLAAINRPSKDQERYLETLSVLFEDYERKHFADDFKDVSPVDVLKFLLESNNMNPSDLGNLLGDRALGCRIINGEREISKSHARTLAKRFNVSLDLFIGYDE